MLESACGLICLIQMQVSNSRAFFEDLCRNRSKEMLMPAGVEENIQLWEHACLQRLAAESEWMDCQDCLEEPHEVHHQYRELVGIQGHVYGQSARHLLHLFGNRVPEPLAVAKFRI